MRAFVPKEEWFEFPEDMCRIVSYLSEHGTLNISEKMVETLYRCFSTECYCAQWMKINDEILYQFARWLGYTEIENIRF